MTNIMAKPTQNNDEFVEICEQLLIFLGSRE